MSENTSLVAIRWYRYEATQYHGGRLTLRVQEFSVKRTTPCGVWLNYGFGEKWVSSTARKRFAYPTKEQAKESFLARKRRHISILKNQLEVARMFKAMAEQGKEDSYELDYDLRAKIADATVYEP